MLEPGEPEPPQIGTGYKVLRKLYVREGYARTGAPPTIGVTTRLSRPKANKTALAGLFAKASLSLNPFLQLLELTGAVDDTIGCVDFDVQAAVG